MVRIGIFQLLLMMRAPEKLDSCLRLISLFLEQLIDGVNSLRERGCTDAPLLVIAEECRDVLGYIRIVPDDDVTEPTDDADVRKSSAVEEDGEDSEEEAEFGVPTTTRAAKPKTGFLDDASFGDEDDFNSEEEFEG